MERLIKAFIKVVMALRIFFKQPFSSPLALFRKGGQEGISIIGSTSHYQNSSKVQLRFLYILKAILMGLLATHAIATIQVYLSNIELYRTVTTMMDSGYLPIPNTHLLPTLREFGPAFWGALFFTLSIGTGLSILSVACAWIWDRLFKRGRTSLIFLMIIWCGLLVLMNSQGFSLMVTLYFLLVPYVTFFFTLRWIPGQLGERVWVKRLCFIFPIAALTVTWASCASNTLFIDIRDYLLLSNSIGQKVDAFYYRYTLYPAEVFKPLEQKTLKSCRLVNFRDPANVKQVERVLINRDYLPLEPGIKVNLEIFESDNQLVFKQRGKTILQTTTKDFFSQPRKIFRQFSLVIDPFRFFRLATMISIFLGFPVFLYMVVFSFVLFILRFFMNRIASFMLTACSCFIIGLALLVPVYLGRANIPDDLDMTKGLRSDRWQTRVFVLRTIVQERLEIQNIGAYQQSQTSPYIPERYWLALVLGISKDPKTYKDLLALAVDPHPNVVSMAFRSLGQRGDGRAIQYVLTLLEESNHWYNQWYAYETLKRLGWRQPLSHSAKNRHPPSKEPRP